MDSSYQTHIDSIEKKIKAYLKDGKKLFVSSSFQTHSIPLLHIISSIDKTIPVFFLNTGYHFSETLDFRDYIQELLDINVINLSSPVPKILQRNNEGKLLFSVDTDNCCYYNKTLPMEEVLLKYDVWINGLRKSQSAYRATFKEEEEAPHQTVRYHPMLEWTNKMIYEYRKANNLKEHPMESKGYFSIGCEPCTEKFIYNDAKGERGNRWKGQNKVECGLHIDLIKK